MSQIIVILLVAYILVPLIDMCLSERVKFAVKLIVYILTFLWVVYATFFVRA